MSRCISKIKIGELIVHCDKDLDHADDHQGAEYVWTQSGAVRRPVDPEWKPLQEPPTRRCPPTERESKTIRFVIGGHKGYLTVGFYSDGTPCEIFLKMAKMGSTLHGFLDAFAVQCSLMLQGGFSVRAVFEKHVGARFEPNGVVEGGGRASSILDWLARFMLGRFSPEWNEEQQSQKSSPADTEIG